MTATRHTRRANGAFPAGHLRILWGKAFTFIMALSLLTLTASVARSDALKDKSDLFLSRKTAFGPTPGRTRVIIRLDRLTPGREAQLRSLGCAISTAISPLSAR
jgi:hypothetical protein